MATNGNINHQEQYANAAAPADPASNPATEANNATVGHSKDEVGWYFVEQYYNTLSKNPHKLHVSFAHYINDLSVFVG